MLNNYIFRAGYYFKRPKVLSFYDKFIKDNLLTVDTLKTDQDAALVSLISFCFDYVPYYQDLFKSLALKKTDFNSTKDLEKIPILTKNEIKEAPERFIPKGRMVDFVSGATGGSTGIPLRYRMSVDCYCRGVALLFRGWGAAGYSLGDKVSIIAGASLVSKGQPLKKKIQDFILNFHHYSSYGMDLEDIEKYINHLKRWKPAYLRGYASSLYVLAKYMEENGISLEHNLSGVFSTAEVLGVKQRQLIERVFNVKVFDNYGLNDGGVSAFECSEHNGMHIDMERSVLEVVDTNGRMVENQMGNIVATSLYNFAMPLIRYDTGDLGILDSAPCSCGCKRPLLKKVYGRTTDYLKLNNKIIGSPVLTVLMGKIEVENYQIIQTSHNGILLKYTNNAELSEDDKLFIRNSFFSHVGDMSINYQKVGTMQLQPENKHKFIINDLFH